MKKLISLTLTAIVIIISSSSCVQAKMTNSDDKSIALIKKFYVEYITFIAHTPEGVNFAEGANAIQKKYSTTSLINKIAKQFENEEIDADPFLKAQDADIRFLETLSVKKDATKPNDFIVSYIYSYISPADNKEVKNQIVIHLTVIKEKDDSLKIDAVW